MLALNRWSSFQSLEVKGCSLRRYRQDSGVDQRYVLVDSPPAPEVPEGSFPVMINTEVMQLREVSPVARILEDAHRATWRLGVYTLPEHRERVARAAERCLGVRKPPRQHTLDSL